MGLLGWFFINFMQQLSAGSLELLPRPEHIEMFVFENGKTARPSLPQTQVGCSDDQSHRTTVKKLVTAGQLIKKTQPPGNMAEVEPGERIVDEQDFGSKRKGASEANAFLPVAAD